MDILPVGECVQWSSTTSVLVAQSTSTTSPNTRPCGVRKRDGTKHPGFIVDYLDASVVLVFCFSLLLLFFADLSIYGPGSKVAQHHGGAVSTPVTTAFAVTTHPFESIKWRLVELQFRTTRDTEGSLYT